MVADVPLKRIIIGNPYHSLNRERPATISHVSPKPNSYFPIRILADITKMNTLLISHKPCSKGWMYDYLFFVCKKSLSALYATGSLFSFEVDLHVIGHVVDVWDHHVSSRMGK